MYHLNVRSPIMNYQKTRKRKIYVDKSLLIRQLNTLIGTDECYVCITRPRRFGKTINANMLGAYYSKGYDSKGLFDNLAIAKEKSYQEHLNHHNVIYIDFSHMPDTCSSYQDYIANILAELKSDLTDAYPQLKGKEYVMISRMLLDTEDSFIFILDEWDSIFRERFMSDEDKTLFLKFLKGLLKGQPYVELAYMTGVLPISRYSRGPELNMFREYNIINDRIYETYFGLSQEEVKNLCKKNNSVNYRELKRWYNGYLTHEGKNLFNPRSVNCALCEGVCLNYWTENGPVNEITDCIGNHGDELKEDLVKLVAGVPVEAELQGFDASWFCPDIRTELLSTMVIYGFLSYHEGILKIPNYELMENFQKVLSCDSMGDIKEIADYSREMLQATINGDEEKIVAILEAVQHKKISFLSYSDESSLACMISLCYLYARRDYEIDQEINQGKWYCDYLFRPKRKGIPAIVLEIRVGRSCEEALEQLKDGNFLQRVKNCQDVLLVGINYDTRRHHKCRIERISLG